MTKIHNLKPIIDAKPKCSSFLLVRFHTDIEFDPLLHGSRRFNVLGWFWSRFLSCRRQMNTTNNFYRTYLLLWLPDKTFRRQQIMLHHMLSTSLKTLKKKVEPIPCGGSKFYHHPLNVTENFLSEVTSLFLLLCVWKYVFTVAKSKELVLVSFGSN